jgi:SulP family sulfate permease
LITVGLILFLERNRISYIRSLSLFLAMAIASAIPWLLRWDNVILVSDVADIPQSLPLPSMPDLSLMPSLIVPAIAVGIRGLVQAASVAQTFPNPDGKFSDTSGDFRGQGLANAVASFFQVLPAGGSSSGTAVLVGAGAQTRWANIFAGIFVAAIVLLFGNLAETIAMPALAGLLMVVGFRMLNPQAVRAVWQTGLVPRTSAAITFAATLMVPLQTAILIGVAVALLLYVFQQSQHIKLVELVWSETQFPEERPAPKELPSNAITTLFVYGSLFFGATGTFEKLLPSADHARRAVVILILRGHSEVGSTFINALTRYAHQLTNKGGKLILAGVSDIVYQQLEKTYTMEIIGKEHVFPAEPRIGLAMHKAYTSALAWLGVKTSTGPAHPEQEITIGDLDAPAQSGLDADDRPDLSEPPAAPAKPSDPLLYLEELERLAQLHIEGVITDEEFAAKKRQILKL